MPNRHRAIIALERASGAYWEETLRIYREAFPTWEREAEHIIAERITQERYKLRVGIENDKVAGFYLLDLNTDPRYVMFSFLAVDTQHQGQGWGTLFCRDAITYFKTFGDFPWLFVEAQESKAIFYGRFGFFKLVLDYQVPRFDGPGSLPMQLMVFPKNEPPTNFPRAELARILRSLFEQGYQLNGDDQRIPEQLARLKKKVKLIAWSKAKSVSQ